jgi:hypothetical protein
MFRSLNQQCIAKLAASISTILNQGFNDRHQRLKQGYVTLIPKKSDYTERELASPASFRPITVLQQLKMFNKKERKDGTMCY